MNYTEGIQQMKNLIGQSGTLHPYEDILISYPVRKKKGNYRVSIRNGQALTHPYICQILYNFIINTEYTYDEMYDFLSDIYTNGTNSNYEDLTLRYYQHLIYWTTLQEEINYPRSIGKAGINLPFCRYYESIYAVNNQLFSIDDVIYRCNNHGNVKPPLYNIPNSPFFIITNIAIYIYLS